MHLPWACRAAGRGSAEPDNRDGEWGFRVAICRKDRLERLEKKGTVPSFFFRTLLRGYACLFTCPAAGHVPEPNPAVLARGGQGGPVRAELQQTPLHRQ